MSETSIQGNQAKEEQPPSKITESVKVSFKSA